MSTAEKPPTEYTVNATCMNCMSNQSVPVKWGTTVSEMYGRSVQCYNCGCEGVFNRSPNSPACLYAIFQESPDDLKEFDMSSRRAK